MDRFAVYLVVVAVLCTLISVITEFTKEVGVLKKIPTSFQVLITSVIVCEVGLFDGLSFYHIAFVWYYPVAAFFGAFVIAIICTRGWDYLISIFKRFYKGGDKEKWHE